MGDTLIEWTDKTVNPIRARLKVKPPDMKARGIGHYCEKVSPGCAECYSDQEQPRFGMPHFDVARRLGLVEVFFDDNQLRKVRGCRAPAKWFWVDMTDIFGAWVERDWQDQCFATMALTPQHTHQVLTKRIDRALAYLSDPETPKRIAAWMVTGGAYPAQVGVERVLATLRWPLPNVWVGASTENQEELDKRYPILMQVPAAVRYLSLEPLLGEIDLGLGRWVFVHRTVRSEIPTVGLRVQPGFYRATSNPYGALSVNGLGIKPAEFERLALIDWAIVGGESAKRRAKARPCDVAWIRSIVQQCQAAGAPCFVKQLGAYAVRREPWITQPTESIAVPLRLRARKGGDPAEWPEDLRVREFPRVAA